MCTYYFCKLALNDVNGSLSRRELLDEMEPNLKAEIRRLLKKILSVRLFLDQSLVLLPLVKIGPSLEEIFQIFRKSSKLKFFEHSFNKDKSVGQKNIRHKKCMKFALIVELEQLNFINITIAKKHLGNHFSFGSI